jgi:hypothetical protein
MYMACVCENKYNAGRVKTQKNLGQRGEVVERKQSCPYTQLLGSTVGVKWSIKNL